MRRNSNENSIKIECIDVSTAEQYPYGGKIGRSLNPRPSISKVLELQSTKSVLMPLIHILNLKKNT